MGQITEAELERIRQYAGDYPSRALAEMLVGAERSRRLDKEFNRRAIDRAEKAELENVKMGCALRDIALLGTTHPGDFSDSERATFYKDQLFRAISTAANARTA